MRKYCCNVFFLISAFLCSCSTVIKSTKAKQVDLIHLDFKVEPATEWSNLFKRSTGWLGGDGIFMIPMSGRENDAPVDSSENCILFSDSMIGDNDGHKEHTPIKMLHNSVAFIKGGEPRNDSLHFYWDTLSKGGAAETIFIPKTISSKPGDYYWLGDGFVNTAKQNTLYIFAYKMNNRDPKDDWSFELTKTNLIAISSDSRPPFKNHRQLETPFSFHGAKAEDKGTFGAAIFVNTKSVVTKNADGYVYVYGVKGKSKSLIAARVKIDNFESFEKWRFWDGRKWVPQMQQVYPIVSGVSDELSLSPLKDGRYLLIYQKGGMGSMIEMRIGASPVGPFGPVINVFDCPESRENNHYFAYNAKAHPSLSKEGELLISYNVNSFNFWEEIKTNPTLYRPRFIKLKFL
jgi:hypothetical protein